MKMQRMLLVVAKHLKHDGVALHVLDEGLGDLHGNLLPPRQKEKKRARHTKITRLPRVFAIVCTHVLHVVKAQWGSLAAVLQGLSGESLVVAMQEAGGRRHTWGVSHARSFY